MVARTGRLRRLDRIRCSRDYQRVSRVGRRLASEYFVVLVASERHLAEGEQRRLGITVSRKVGGAVVRNRVKRMVRQWFREHRQKLPRGCDLVVIARSPSADLRGRELAGILSEMVGRLGARSEA